MTVMVTYECGKCGSVSARRCDDANWRCDYCKSYIHPSDANPALVFVEKPQNESEAV